MNILTFRTNEELNEAGANIITSLVQTNPKAIIGLATGSSPIGIYEDIVKTFRKGAVSFRQVSTFNLDEYVGLPIDHPESYHNFMQRHLFDHIDVPASQINIPDGNAGSLTEECARYNRKLDDAKQIDLQILGIGHNGHIGFNEPSHALLSGTHIVELKAETREANARFFDSIDDVPTHALTMGVGAILKAKTILLVVRGESKAEIVHRALTGPISTECPASLLQTHSNVVVLLDAEAGRLFAE